jgi:hypothetical protein
MTALSRRQGKSTGKAIEIVILYIYIFIYLYNTTSVPQDINTPTLCGKESKSLSL